MSSILHEMCWNNRSHRRILPRSSNISPHWGGVVTGCVPLCQENMCMLHKQGGVWRRSPSLSRPSRPAVPSVHSCCWLWATRRSAWAESRSALVCGGRRDAGGFWHIVSPLLPSPCQGGRAAAASWRLEAQSWIFRSRVGLGGQNKHQSRLLITVNNL